MMSNAGVVRGEASARIVENVNLGRVQHVDVSYSGYWITGKGV